MPAQPTCRGITGRAKAKMALGRVTSDGRAGAFDWMDGMDLETQLAEIGISGKLYSAYMASLELGEASVNQIATRASLERTTAYNVIERLQQEGLVIVLDRDGKRIVTPQDPQAMLRRAEERRRALSDLMPQLRSLYNSSRVKPEIRFYEGEEGVATVLWDTLTARSKMLRGILSMAELLESPGFEKMERYIVERVRKGIVLKALRSSAKDTDSIWSGPDALREVRHAPEHIILAMTSYIYDDKVAIISSKREDYGMIIQSQDFANLHAAMFDGLWAISTPRAES
jgi:sugar-specific transcriptional regulator TrmB